ncbi:hypothetical protein SDC9_184828 [bioreactor metagenome]|uniref:Uncharacterized protein n=1 Tax=bioreactor metagenome TaxID=1076179 RepID=A0A645HG01_9ZZZZ
MLPGAFIRNFQLPAGLDMTFVLDNAVVFEDHRNTGVVLCGDSREIFSAGHDMEDEEATVFFG